MYKLTSLGSEPKQQIIVLLSDNSRVTFNFEYKPNQLGWFFTFTYDGQTYGKFRLTTNYNILESFKTTLPFGLRCDTPDSEEPYDLDDFARNYAKVYLLTRSDISAIDIKYYSRNEVVSGD